MPGYTIDSEVLYFVRSPGKFGSRHTTRGLDDIAKLDDNAMTQLSIAVMSIGADELNPGQRACAAPSCTPRA